MRRREFIALLGSAAALPIAAHGEQPATPVIGFLNGATAKGFAPNVSGFLQGLKEAGYVDGQNVAIEYRWAEGHYERLADMAADLVHRQVRVIAANTSAAPAAKAATTTIPIVFINGTGPVSEALVKSMNRPGGNATGVSVVSDVLVAKQLDMLRELAPAATLIRPSFQSTNPIGKRDWATPKRQRANWNATPRPQCQQRSRDRRRVRFAGGTRAVALVVMPYLFLITRRNQIATLAASHKIPIISPLRDFVDARALASYAPAFPIPIV